MKKLLSFVAAMLFAAASFAQADEVTITVLGTGVDEEKATLQALRSAIEQTFGAFVSSNTTILNDELVQDEIVSVSTGNVKKYNKIAVATLPNGHVSVSLTATVSINKLISYAENKGVKAEFAGSVYATNVKLFRLKIQSIQKAYELMVEQLELIAEDMFDFKFEMGEQPQRYQSEELGDVYYFDCYVGVVSNAASTNFYNLYRNTVNKLTLSNDDLEFCKQENISVEDGPFDSKLPLSSDEYNRHQWRLYRAVFDAYYKYRVQEIDNPGNAYYYRDADGRSFADLGITGGYAYQNYDEDYSLYSKYWRTFLTSCMPLGTNEHRSRGIYVGGMTYEGSWFGWSGSNPFSIYAKSSRLVAIHRFRTAIIADQIERFKGFEIAGASAFEKTLLPEYEKLWGMVKKTEPSWKGGGEYPVVEFHDRRMDSSQGRSSTANSSRSRRLRISTTSSLPSTTTQPSYGRGVINRAVNGAYGRTSTPSRTSTSYPRSSGSYQHRSR